MATRWLGKAGKAVGKAAGGVAAMARTTPLRRKGWRRSSTKLWMTRSRRGRGGAGRGGGGGGRTICAGAGGGAAAARPLPWRRRRPREDDAVAAEPEPEPEPDVVDEDDDRGEAEAEADEEEVDEEPEEEEEAGEIYLLDLFGEPRDAVPRADTGPRHIIQLTTAPPAPAPPPDAPTLAERASSEPAGVYFV